MLLTADVKTKGSVVFSLDFKNVFRAIVKIPVLKAISL